MGPGGLQLIVSPGGSLGQCCFTGKCSRDLETKVGGGLEYSTLPASVGFGSCVYISSVHSLRTKKPEVQGGEMTGPGWDRLHGECMEPRGRLLFRTYFTHPPRAREQLSGYRNASMHYSKARGESLDPGYSHPHGLTSWAL